MQNPVRGRPRVHRLALLDEEDSSSSPSYFEWREQTVRTRAYQPVPKAQPKLNSFIRLFRRFG